jgi:hypothetical protein
VLPDAGDVGDAGRFEIGPDARFGRAKKLVDDVLALGD